jgi:hypothetical protein
MKKSKLTLFGTLFLVSAGILTLFAAFRSESGREPIAGGRIQPREGPGTLAERRIGNPESLINETGQADPKPKLAEAPGAEIETSKPTNRQHPVVDGSVAQVEIPPLSARGTKSQSSRSDSAEPDGSTEEQTAVAPPHFIPPPPGIRLAPDVRLPVAAMPVSIPLNPVKERMLKIIVDDYYRDLAGSVIDPASVEGSTGQPGLENPQVHQVTEPGGETTMVVGNGPLANAARKRADYRFRAIFGKTAFNNLSMQTSMEARLPVE